MFLGSLGENSWSGWGRIGVSEVPGGSWSGNVEEDCCLWGPYGREAGVVMWGRIGVSGVLGGRIGVSGIPGGRLLEW